MELPLFANGSAVDRPLFPHQRKAISMLKASLKAGNTRIVVQLPTGAGTDYTALPTSTDLPSLMVIWKWH